MKPFENSYIVPDTTLVAGEYPGSPAYHSDRQRDQKLGAFLDAGITAVVDLTRREDGLEPYAERLAALAAERGLDVRYTNLPIRDMGVCDAQAMERILDEIDSHLAAGRVTYVHCWGGVGRTGTVIGCWLVRHGRTGENALAEVSRLFATMSAEKLRHHPEGSPQTPSQREMVKSWRAAAKADAATISIRENSDDSSERVQTRIARATSARSLHTRIRGCLLGGAVGDALGWPVEFRSLAEIRERYGPEGIREYDPLAPGGLGAITDDTQMTLFTAEGILRSTTRYVERSGCDSLSGPHRPHTGCMWHALVRWRNTQDSGRSIETPGDIGWLSTVRELRAVRAPGNTCMTALSRPDVGVEGRAPNSSKGCGGVMRVAPIGLVPTEDPFAYACMAAALTHGHPTGYLAAGAYAQIVSDIVFDHASLGDAVARAIARLETERDHQETSSTLRRALTLAAEPGAPSADRVARLGQGWVAEEALAIGVYCALVAEDFESGVRLAVNHAGDSDSTGSIAGALLGAQLGQYGIPARFIRDLELRDVICAVADDLLIGYGGGQAWRERYPGA